MRKPEMKTIASWPTGKMAAFAIRDDDVSFFTQPWMLDALYKKAWQLGFKVSLAAIPKVSRNSRHFSNVISKNLPYLPSEEYFSINNNVELINYLIDKIEAGKVDIIQHGYTHADGAGKAEFALNDFQLINERLRSGNELLRKTFGQPITVFAAPHEKVSRATWKSLKLNNMSLSRDLTLGRVLTTATPSSDVLKLVSSSKNLNPFSLLSSSMIDLDGVLVIQWDSLFSAHGDPKDQLNQAKEKLRKRVSRGEPYVLLHHYWEYFPNWNKGETNIELLNEFNEFLEFVASKDEVWKTSLSEICSWLRSNKEKI